MSMPTPEEMARIVLSKDAPRDLVSKVAELIACRDEAMLLRGEMAGARKAREAVADLLAKTAELLGQPDLIVQLRETVLGVDKASPIG
jgi:predicted component of type VI protein secretion system